MDEQQQPDARQSPRPESEAPAAETQPGSKRLYRDPEQRILLGVCGGLARYFDVDPTIVRLVFVLLALLGGGGILLYIALAIIMPAADKLDEHPREAAKATVDEAVEGTQRAVGGAVDWVREKVGRPRSRSGDANPEDSRDS